MAWQLLSSPTTLTRSIPSPLRFEPASCGEFNIVESLFVYCLGFRFIHRIIDEIAKNVSCFKNSTKTLS